MMWKWAPTVVRPVAMFDEMRADAQTTAAANSRTLISVSTMLSSC